MAVTGMPMPDMSGAGMEGAETGTDVSTDTQPATQEDAAASQTQTEDETDNG